MFYSAVMLNKNDATDCGIQGLGKTVQSITVCSLKFGPPSQADQADYYGKPSPAGTEEEGLQVHSYRGTSKCGKFNVDIMMIFKA